MFTFIRLSWKPPLNPNGAILSYEIVYVPIVGQPVEVNVRLNRSYIIANLLPRTLISKIIVFPINGQGRGEQSIIENIETVEPPREKTNSELIFVGCIICGKQGNGGGGWH